MVTNLPEKAKAQWIRVVSAKDPEMKLVELERFYSMIPKHKGTKNLVKYIRSKISALREEIEEEKRKIRGVRYVSPWSQRVHGVCRISLISYDIAVGLKVFKFMTGRAIQEPVYEPKYSVLTDGEVQFQVSLLPELTLGGRMTGKVFSYLSSSKVVFIACVDSSIKEYFDFLRRAEEYGYLVNGGGEVRIVRLSSGGLRIVGRVKDASMNELMELLKSYGYRNAVVKLIGEVSIDDVEKEILGLRKKIIALPVRIEGEKLVISKPSEATVTIHERRDLVNYLLKKLSLIRVYTKLPREKPSGEPLILKSGAAVMDLAEEIHSRLVNQFRYALVWRQGRGPVRVSRNFKLMDGDVVEIRT